MELCCPFCGKKFSELVKKGGAGSHLRVCRKNYKIEDSIPNYVYTARYNFGEEITSKEFIEQKILKEGYSVYEYDQVFFKGKIIVRKLAEFYGLKMPTHSESANNPRRLEKMKSTCMERYGTINPCAAGTPGRAKAEATMKDKYGTINFFGVENFQQYMIDRLGEDEYHRRKSKRSHDVWANKTEEERDVWLGNSILSPVAVHNKFASNSNISKAELQFDQWLISKGFEIETQFLIKDGNKRYYFDARLKESNILVEFNGTYWHCDPNVYHENDLASFPFGKIPAKDIWERDKKKISVAEKSGFKVIIIWESEFNSKDFEKIFFDKLLEVGFENYKIEIDQEN